MADNNDEILLLLRDLSRKVMIFRKDRVVDSKANVESLFPAMDSSLFDALTKIVSPDFINSGSFKVATSIVGESLRDDFSDLDSSFE